MLKRTLKSNPAIKKTTTPTSFTVTLYNILAQGLHHKSYANKNKTVPSIECWNKRWTVLKQEFVKLRSDIYCLVEVENSVFNNELKQFFYFDMKQNFNGVYSPREYHSSETKPMDQLVGNAIFFNCDRFRIVQTQSFDYKKEATNFLKNKKVKITKNILKKINMECGGIGIILEDLKTFKRCLIYCNHSYYNPTFDDVKNFQIFLTMKLIDDMSENGKLPVIFAGDFNITPHSCSYNALINGVCDNNFDFAQERTGKPPLNPIIKVPRQFSNQKLTSAYNSILNREPLITTATEHFRNCLDYIFINNKLTANAILDELPETYIRNIKYIPNKQHPSDHIPLKVMVDYT